MSAIGGPVVLVDVRVGGGDLAEVAGGDVDECEALFEEGVFDLAGLGSFGDQRTCGASGILREEDGDGFAVRGPTRSVQEAFHVGEFFRYGSGAGLGDGENVQLELIFFDRVGKEGKALAVGRPGQAAFGMICVDCGGDALRRRACFQIFHVDRGVTIGCAVFAG